MAAQDGATLIDALASALATDARGGARLIGISGPQGSGKSTLAAALATALAAQHRLNAVVVGLDDFYLGRAARQALARTVHPLLATRGVPGTHDVALLHGAFDALLGGHGAVALPQFDKARDDRAAAPRQIDAPVDLLLFEGWCIGARAQPDGALDRPVNALEAEEDGDGRWRRWVNAQLAGDYATLFARLDRLVLLHPARLAQSQRWRQQQEAELRAARGRGMSVAEVARFMAHYERVTRALRRSLPRRADYVIDIAADHRLARLRAR